LDLELAPDLGGCKKPGGGLMKIPPLKVGLLYNSAFVHISFWLISMAIKGRVDCIAMHDSSSLKVYAVNFSLASRPKLVILQKIYRL
jgi:hypothetical protein